MWVTINLLMLLIKLILSLIITQSKSHAEILRPRGVPFSRKIFYDPSKDFTCLDGSVSIPFIMVNDDYCDCDDGSDEPGTSACPNGLFHCSNIGYIERLIPSSRVNDGICDCCDGSDEYNSSVQCINNCMVLGEQLRAEQYLQMKLLEEGNKIREQYIEHAKQKIEQNKAQLEELKNYKSQLEEEKNTKDAIKKEAEEKEKAALDKYKAEEERLRKQKEEEDLLKAQQEERKLAEIAFVEMDINKDNVLSYTEVQQFSKFDKDSDGIVSDEEAKFFLHAANEMEFEEFATTAWIIMKPYYMRDTTTQAPVESVDTVDVNAVETETESEVEHENTETETETETETDTQTDENAPDQTNLPADEDEEEDHPPYYPPKDAELLDLTTPSPFESPEYDEETKNLIELAKKAREDYSEIEGKFLDTQNKFRELEVTLETDYGVHHEFLPLHGQCFELTDREYIYKLCPFESASQRPKEGTGSETSLGRWGSWAGPEGNKYGKMKFEGGAQCWNGPSRSVVIVLKCGLQNELTAASEPSRCEYQFDFSTPASCIPLPDSNRDVHDEL